MGWQYVDAEDADQRYKIGEWRVTRRMRLRAWGCARARPVERAVCCDAAVQGSLCLRWLN